MYKIESLHMKLMTLKSRLFCYKLEGGVQPHVSNKHKYVSQWGNGCQYQLPRGDILLWSQKYETIIPHSYQLL